MIITSLPLKGKKIDNQPPLQFQLQLYSIISTKNINQTLFNKFRRIKHVAKTIEAGLIAEQEKGLFY
jgi:hypothetical protein